MTISNIDFGVPTGGGRDSANVGIAVGLLGAAIFEIFDAA